MIFLLHVDVDLKCLPINFYLLTMLDALCDGHFLDIRRGVELH